MLRCLAILAFAALGGAAAADANVEELVNRAIRANGCAMTDEEARAHFDAAGVPWAEVLDAVRAMAARDYLFVTRDGGEIVINPSFCHPDPIVLPAGTVRWVLQMTPGCRLPRTSVERVVRSNGSPEDTILPGIAEMIADGRLREEGTDLVLSNALCAEGEPQEPADAITFESMHGGTLRGGMHALARDWNCRLPWADREAAAREIAAALPHYLLVFGEIRPDGRAALEARVREVLDDPKQAFVVDEAAGELVLASCLS